MKTTFLNIILRSWGLMKSTALTWESIISDTEEKKPFRKYFMPLLLVCVAVVLIFKTIYANNKHVQTGFVYAVVMLIAYVGAFYLTRYLSGRYILKNHPDKKSDILLEKLIAYSFSVVFAIKLITSIIPSLFFLQILNVYTIYIVWEGCRVMFDIDEDERGKIMLIVGLTIMFAPAVISKVVLFMLPGF